MQIFSGRLEPRSCASNARRRKGAVTVSASTLILSGDESILRYHVSDAELEAAAEETALSYTYQTSAYEMCCQ